VGRGAQLKGPCPAAMSGREDDGVKHGRPIHPASPLVARRGKKTTRGRGDDPPRRGALRGAADGQWAIMGVTLAVPAAKTADFLPGRAGGDFLPPAPGWMLGRLCWAAAGRRVDAWLFT